MGNTRCHAIIVGAGLGGLAAAISIARAGHKVTVLERANELGEVGAGIQIPPNSSRILAKWGILERIEELSIRPYDFIFRSYRDGRVLSQQNMVPFTQEVYGAPYLHIYRPDYHQVLVDETIRLQVPIVLKADVAKINFDKPSVITADGIEYTADLVIGADGIKSFCRQELLGRPDPPQLTGDLAYRVVVKQEDMLKDPELRSLALKPVINYWMGPNGHAVCYRLGGGLYNIVLICPDDLPEFVNTAEADLDEMMAFFQKWDPKLKRLLGMVTSTQKWRLQNVPEMKSWSHPKGKFTLLGDACHATLPYLAQGAAQAIEDGAIIGALLQKLETKSQIPDILQMYERLRKPRTTSIVQGSTDLRNVFHMPDGDKQRERDRRLLEETPAEGYPNLWVDPVFQRHMFGYDVFAVAAKAWAAYKGNDVLAPNTKLPSRL